jgi:hypothetical protein
MTNKNSNMSNILSSIPFFLIFCFVFLSIPQAVMAKKGVDDLRGRWDISIEGFEENLQNFTMFIGNLIYTEETGDFLANGCMESPSQELSPLAFKAKLIEEGTYDVTIISTVIPDENGLPFVIQFFGKIHTLRKGIVDDFGGGDDSKIKTEFFEGGNWTAKHVDKSNEECPPVEIPPLYFEVDVVALHNLRRGEVEQNKTIFGAQTNIISSGVLVEKPDGSKVTIPAFTDIFSPYTDFVSSFRYMTPFEEADDGDPISGKTYYFTLLDVLGNPILGSTKTDIWTGCYISAPTHIVVDVLANNDLRVQWNEVPKANGFDPSNGVGFYHIETFGWSLLNHDTYGGSQIQSTWHIVPWNDFFPVSDGNPDGYDFGVGLNRFTNGIYMLRVVANSMPPEGIDGKGNECAVVDFGENILFEKLENKITIFGLVE